MVKKATNLIFTVYFTEHLMLHKLTHLLLEKVQNASLLTASSGNLVCTTLMREGVNFHWILSRSLSVREQDTVDYMPASKKYTWETGLGLGSRTQALCSIIFKTLI